MRNVYMDNNATTPIHPEVKKAMFEAMDWYGNASSMHNAGRLVRGAIEAARQKLADFIGALPEEIIFTSGASEANNSVLNNMICPSRKCSIHDGGKYHIVTSTIEHPSVLETAKCLKSKGLDVTLLPVDSFGKVDPADLRKSIRSEETILVSIMAANNEIGTIQNIKALADIARAQNVSFHSDAVQAIGKIPFKVGEMGLDFLSLSAHKFYGPKGIGALYIRKGVCFCPLITGGHHEFNRRAGTENTLGIIGLGKAIEMLGLEMTSSNARLSALKQRLKEGIIRNIPDIHFNGHPTDSLPGTLNVSFKGIEGESILLYMDLEGIAVSTGSACSTGSLTPSHVIMATGAGAELAHGSIRFSLGRENTVEDVDYVVEKLTAIVARLRAMSPVYFSAAD